MFEELKKKTLKSSIVGSIILILVGLGLAGWNALDAFYSIKGYTDFYTLAPEEVSNQIVTVDLTDNYGCYLEEYERNTKTNQRRTTHLYYIITVGDTTTDDWYYMSIKVPGSYETRMERMLEGDNTSITFSGKIKKLSDEDYSYFMDYFLEAGFTEEEFKD